MVLINETLCGMGRKLLGAMGGCESVRIYTSTHAFSDVYERFAALRARRSRMTLKGCAAQTCAGVKLTLTPAVKLAVMFSVKRRIAARRAPSVASGRLTIQPVQVYGVPMSKVVVRIPAPAIADHDMACELSVDASTVLAALDAATEEWPEQGGLVTFSGIVRDHNQGKEVERIEYEAYDQLVLSTLSTIVEGIERSIAGSRVAVVHRAGVLVVGDAAVVIAASAPHRAESYDACRRAIEELKKEVPIWKKEVSPSGEEWLGMRP